jgi:Sec63 Brl domain
MITDRSIFAPLLSSSHSPRKSVRHLVGGCEGRGENKYRKKEVKCLLFIKYLLEKEGHKNQLVNIGSINLIVILLFFFYLKVYILLQSYLSGTFIEGFALVSDSNYVAQNAAR